MPVVGPFRAVLFDFDYTLGDSSDGIVLCANQAMKALGRPPAAPAAIRRTIGLSLERMFERLTGTNGPDARRFRDLFIRCADREMGRHTRLYPEVPGLLEELASRGLRLGVVTTKVRRRVEQALGPLGLAARFDVMVGSDMVTHPKPHPESLELALGLLGLEPAAVLYLGDSTVDGEAAAAAGVPFAAVLTGTTAKSDLEALRPVVVLPHVADLPAWLDRTTPE